jgi:glycerol-3-phosphate cytidylyltransferase
MKLKETITRSCTKSVIWRIVGVIILAAITYFYTQNWIAVGLITVLHHGIFLIVFAVHERVWLRIRIKNYLVRSLLKMFTYETILGNVILGTITWLVTGNPWTATQITITYISIKHVIYIFNEFIWKKIKWGKVKTGYAYACGDILHFGHIRHFKNCKKHVNYLVVGVLTNEAIEEKKPAPLLQYKERARVIEALKYVDRVVPQYQYSPLKNIKNLKPDILFESNYHKEMPANDYVEKYGGQVIVLPYYKKQSSSKIKSRIKSEK